MPNDAEPDQVFACKTYSQADQQRFAALSGDVNPMHMDPVAARRLITGRQVVHGVHALLTGLEQWSGSAGAPPSKIGCDFVNPICVGDRVDFVTSTGVSTLGAKVGEMTCCHIDVQFDVKVDVRVDFAPSGLSGPPGNKQPVNLTKLEPLSAPLELSPETCVGRHDAISLPATCMADEFPRLSAWLGERRVAALSLLSYYVGMVCPGMDSVFASLNFGLAEAREGAEFLSFRVRRFDPRYRVFFIAFDGCIRGEIKAFLRAKPQGQTPMSALLDKVSENAFRPANAWVIGGSRGLGEITAKLIAAGGGNVTLTYASGADDALKVAAQINAVGRGQAKVRKLDLATDSLSEWVMGGDQPEVIFYFATPKIFRKKNSVFDAALFTEFLDFYVNHLYALAAALLSLNPTTLIKVFQPSTVALDDRPKGMTEYTMAKAAAEVLVADLNRALSSVALLSQRLPRLATDQTSSPFIENTMSNVDVMLPIIESMLGRRATPNIQ